MKLTIKYINGEMCINLEEFLNVRSMSKFKKLLKIIDASYTPEVKEQIKEYITGFLLSVDMLLNDYENKIKQYDVEQTKATYRLKSYIEMRSNYRKNTEIYKKCDELVKKQRKDVAMWKTMFRQYKQRFKETQKNKEFYKKCLELL